MPGGCQSPSPRRVGALCDLFRHLPSCPAPVSLLIPPTLLLAPYPTAPYGAPSSCVDSSHILSPSLSPGALEEVNNSTCSSQGGGKAWRRGLLSLEVGLTSSCPIPWLHRALFPTCKAGEGKLLSRQALPGDEGSLGRSGRSEGELYRCSASLPPMMELCPASLPSHCPTPALPSPPPLRLFLSPSIIFILFFFGVPIKAGSFNHPQL